MKSIKYVLELRHVIVFLDVYGTTLGDWNYANEFHLKSITGR
jgi:hypothetical protein